MRGIRATFVGALAAAAFGIAAPTGAGVACTIQGDGGDDLIEGTQGRDVICSRGGDDRIEALGGNDVVYAGRGDDTISGGRGGDRVFGGPGTDNMAGDAGGDKLLEQGGRGYAAGDGGRDLVKGGRGSDRCLDVRSGGRDRIVGGPGTDTYSADDGDVVRSAENEENCIAPPIFDVPDITEP